MKILKVIDVDLIVLFEWNIISVDFFFSFI